MVDSSRLVSYSGGVWSWVICSVNMVLGASGALWDRFSVFGAFSWDGGGFS